MKHLLNITLITVWLTACDSKQEQARKAQLENHADKLEQAAKTAEKSAVSDAEVLKKEGEARAEVLRTEAERTREQK